MTRSTPSLHHIADHELSAAAAMRTLRSIAYRDWDEYRAPVVPEADESDDAFGPFILDLSLVEHDAGPEFVMPVSSSQGSDASRTWYLNEVPSEWLGEYRRDEHSSTPLSA